MLPRRRRNVPRVKPLAVSATAVPSILRDWRDPKSIKRWWQYHFTDRVIGISEFAVYYLFRLLPVRICSAIGALRGRYSGKSRQRVEAQAREALGIIAPELSTANVNEILTKLHSNSGRALLETLIMDRIWDEGHVSVNSEKPLDELKADHRSKIFVSVHLGNLGDLQGMCLMRLSGARGMTVTRIQPNRFRQRLSEKLRAMHGADILEPGLKATKQLIKHLRSPGNILLIHLDEARARQVYFPTFGRPLPYGGNLSVAIRLSAITGAPIIPVFMRRCEEVDFELNILGELDIPEVNNDKQHMHIAEHLDILFTNQIRQTLHDWQQLYFLRLSKKTD